MYCIHSIYFFSFAVIAPLFLPIENMPLQRPPISRSTCRRLCCGNNAMRHSHGAGKMELENFRAFCFEKVQKNAGQALCKSKICINHKTVLYI
jgi:hypothetical protein